MADHPLRSATDRRLGGPLPHQLANQTRAHLLPIKSLTPAPCGAVVSCGISTTFAALFPSRRQVAHALLTRPPLELTKIHPKTSFDKSPLDLHVLGTPPAFVLSQDQTLMFNPLNIFSDAKLKLLTVVCVSCFCIVFKVRRSLKCCALERACT